MPQPRRKLLAIDDPLEVGGRGEAEKPPSPPAPEPEPSVPAVRPREAPVAPSRAEERRALFVRLSLEEADAVARAAFELGVHKQELIGALVRRYVDARSPEGLAALREMLRRV